LARFQAVGTGQSFAKVKEFGATVRVAFDGGGHCELPVVYVAALHCSEFLELCREKLKIAPKRRERSHFTQLINSKIIKSSSLTDRATVVTHSQLGLPPN